MPKIDQIEGLRQELDSSVRKWNFENQSVATDDEFSHQLSTLKLYVEFYDNGIRVNRSIDWEPISRDKIKIYLPFGINTWTGDIFIIKR